MCLAVYIACDNTLPLIKWDAKQPRFNVVPLDHNDKVVTCQFRYPYVLYAGSHEGCGCGFIKEGEVGEQLEMVQSNYKQLASYLQKLRTSGYNIEIFVCWEGGQGAEPELRQRISVETLVMEGFEFQEKTYYEIE